MKSDLLSIEKQFISRDPDVIAQASQISYPSVPSFKNYDLPEEFLSANESNQPVREQIKTIRILNDRIEKAKEFLPFLYSYRSVVFALTSDENVSLSMKHGGKDKDSEIQLVDINKMTNLFHQFFENKLQSFFDIMEFNNSLVSILVSIIKNEKLEPNDVLFDKMTEIFYLMFNIDQLKLLKTGISNDISFYKRDKNLNTDIREKSQHLQIFWNSQYYTLNALHEFIMADSPKFTVRPPSTLNFMVKYLTFLIRSHKERLLVPTQRSSIIVGMIAALYIHGSKNPMCNIFTQPIVKEIFEILGTNPIVPLFGENSFVPGYVFKSIEGFIPPKVVVPIQLSEIRQVEHSFLLKNKITHFRDLYRKNLPLASKMARDGFVSLPGLRDLLISLSEMTYAVYKQSSIKFILTAPKPSTQDQDGITPYMYDLAVKYNYTADDLNALAEVIGYIKTLASITILAEPTIFDFVAKDTFTQLQFYLENAIEGPLARAKASNDNMSAELLQSICSLFSDNKTIKPEKKPKSGNWTLSPHQLDVLRIQLEYLIQPGSRFLETVNVFTGSHFRKTHVKMTQDFLATICEWYHFLNFIPVVREATNLGSLWFRETCLDIDKVLQFPVDSSLPFILAEHLLHTSNQPSLHDSLFFPFELYNDAAALAIHTFKCQHLYHEIEAEVTICIDMIAVTFSETFYKSCRITAAAMELPPDWTGKIVPTPMRYSIMIAQNKMELLGFNVDFNLITTSKLNLKLRKELESYIDLLSDLRLAQYVYHLFCVVRSTHSMLLESKLPMDSFETIWAEARGSESPIDADSRIRSLVSKLLDFSHFRLHCAARKFSNVKSLSFSPWSNEEWARVYFQIHQDSVQSVNADHLHALCSLLSYGEISQILHVCNHAFEENLNKSIELYIQISSVLKRLQVPTKDDIISFFHFNSDAYGSITHPLLGKFFDSMRVLGNIIMFLYMLEDEMPSTDLGISIMSPPMNLIRQAILDNSNHFIPPNLIELDSVINRRSFPSLWPVLEFILCSPKPVQLGENNTVIPIESFGEGPALAAHVFITISNTRSFYYYDSICYKAGEIAEWDRSKIERSDINAFLLYSNQVKSARKHAEIIAWPYHIETEQ